MLGTKYIWCSFLVTIHILISKSCKLFLVFSHNSSSSCSTTCSTSPAWCSTSTLPSTQSSTTPCLPGLPRSPSIERSYILVKPGQLLFQVQGALPEVFRLRKFFPEAGVSHRINQVAILPFATTSCLHSKKNQYVFDLILASAYNNIMFTF